MWRELAERIEKLGVSQGLVQYERKQVKYLRYVLGRHSALKGLHSASSSPSPIFGRQPCTLLKLGTLETLEYSNSLGPHRLN